jgi:hypothetical protein
MHALVARWLAVIVMLGLLALVWVTNQHHARLMGCGIRYAGEDAKRRSPP